MLTAVEHPWLKHVVERLDSTEDAIAQLGALFGSRHAGGSR